MNRVIEIRPEALEELGVGLDHIAREDPSIAFQIEQQVLDTIERLAEGAFHGRKILLRVGGFAYRWPALPFVLYYERSNLLLRVLAIRHHARESIER